MVFSTQINFLLNLLEAPRRRQASQRIKRNQSLLQRRRRGKLFYVTSDRAYNN